MTRPHASLEESQQRGRAKQAGRYRNDAQRFPCGHQMEGNTVTRYGRDYCLQCKGGVIQHERSASVTVGKRFGMLTVTSLLPAGKAKCICDCGKKTEAWTGNLQKGATASCGCTRGTHKFQEQACALAQVWK